MVCRSLITNAVVLRVTQFGCVHSLDMTLLFLVEASFDLGADTYTQGNQLMFQDLNPLDE